MATYDAWGGSWGDSWGVAWFALAISIETAILMPANRVILLSASEQLISSSASERLIDIDIDPA